MKKKKAEGGRGGKGKKLKQIGDFVLVLSIKPHLLDKKGWRESENAAVLC